MEKLALRQFQEEDVMVMRAADYRVLNANAPGTGKTIEVLACIRIDSAKLLPALIVAPSSVVKNWVREAKKWLPRGVRTQAIKGSTQPIRRDAHIVVISWAVLARMQDDLLRWGPRLIVVDEAHYAKNPEAQRTRALQALAAVTPHILLLTGTPLINDESELDFLQSLFGTKSPRMIRRLIEDVAPDVPPKTRTLLPIRLTGPSGKEYREAEGDFGYWLEGELAKYMSLGQAQAAAEAALVNEALVKIGYLRRLLGRAKVAAALDWTFRAVTRGEPVVVFAEHQRVISAYSRGLKRLNVPFVTIVGNTSRDDREQAVDLFQAGRVPVFIGSKAAKEGITLHKARHMLFLERWFTSADEEQAEDRIRRLGQPFPTTIWFLHALNTIDDRLDEIIRHKRRLVRTAIGSADIKQRDEDVALEIVRQWASTKQRKSKQAATDLGVAWKDIQPLPRRNQVQALVFAPPRWDEPAAIGWCRLFGYPVRHVSRTADDGMRVTSRLNQQFIEGSFHVVPIAEDIYAICGARN